MSGANKPLALVGRFSELRPGAVADATDDDPSGIAMYSSAGATLGTKDYKLPKLHQMRFTSPNALPRPAKKGAVNCNCCKAPERRLLQIQIVKAPCVVLLTSDAALENVVADTLIATGGISYLARNAGDALQIVCGTGRDLDLAVIDFEHGPHGMTLLKAIDACRKDFPMIVIMREGQQHVEPLARANGAVECFSKPVAAEQLAEVFQRCCRRRDPLALVA